MTPVPDDSSVPQQDLQWVLAGYENQPWTQMLEVHAARLFRVGAWWRKSQTSVPVSVDVVNERVVVINSQALVIDAHGDVAMVLRLDARSTPSQSLCDE